MLISSMQKYNGVCHLFATRLQRLYREDLQQPIRVCVIHLKARDLPTPCMVRVVDYIFEYERAAIFNMIQLVRTGLMFFSLPGLMF